MIAVCAPHRRRRPNVGRVLGRQCDHRNWAARCIGHELRVNVVEHDDNSSPGMFDLSIAYPDRLHGPSK